MMFRFAIGAWLSLVERLVRDQEALILGVHAISQGHNEMARFAECGKIECR